MVACGKIKTQPPRALKTVQDLAFAQTPGVAEPCLAIAKEPEMAFKFTNKGRMVCIVSNGTSVMGLGELGALACKPDLEGKVALCKTLADVDCLDLCVDTSEVD